MSNYYNFSSSNFIMATTCRTKKKSDYENFISTLKDLGLEKKSISSLNQIHSSNIKVISNPGIYDKSDGIISKIDNQLTLVIKTADCIPMFMYDNSNGVYALIHAGWKGAQKKIHLKAVNKFLDFNSLPKNIEVYMGPSLRQCCFEIKKDLVEIFDNQFIIKKDNKYYLNLIKFIINGLNNLGVNKIVINKSCTYEDKNCYSYRSDKQNNSRMYSLMHPLSCKN